MSLVEQRPAHVPLTQACDALDLNRSSVYDRRRPRSPTSEPRRQSVQPRALSAEQRNEVLQTLHSEPFQDQPPAQVYQRLLGQDQYLCSISTMHRLLREADESGERRHQRPAQSHAVPRLAAKAPNQVWTWDISKLATSVRGHYLNLYVILDLYSRFVVAWMVSSKENSALSSQLIQQAIEHHQIAKGQLTLHQDQAS